MSIFVNKKTVATESTYRHILLSNYTENQKFYVTTLKHDLNFSKVPRYETLAFKVKIDGTLDVDRHVKSIDTNSEDQAYVNHMELWDKLNRGKHD